MIDFTTPHDAETLEALQNARDRLRRRLIQDGGDAQDWDVALWVSAYHAANEELRIASAKAARIEAGENYVNETA